MITPTLLRARSPNPATRDLPVSCEVAAEKSGVPVE